MALSSDLIKPSLIYPQTALALTRPHDDARLNGVLQIDPVRFQEAYNLDITEYVDRHTFKESAQARSGAPAKEILYMSYSHAVRLFRQYFPELEIEFVVNPATNGYLHKEIDDRGYFVRLFIHDGRYRSTIYHFGVLSQVGAAVFPTDMVKEKLVANSQLFNLSVYRAMVKAIALTTGIGLKLWTGDDLDEEVVEGKLKRIRLVWNLVDQFRSLGGVIEDPKLDYTSSLEQINATGKWLQKLIEEQSNKGAN
ncbi:DUF1071 domain-containing protein [Chroococcidiopsis sp.]|uniref:Sak single strand annealing protein n=1 Tax=Chroococcidiopsis sp. TaxID=3088168 RepID=UPI003F33F273